MGALLELPELFELVELLNDELLDDMRLLELIDDEVMTGVNDWK